MYAAAGGASCRNARKRQAIQNVKDKEAQAKALKEKLEAAKAAQLSAHPKSKQFHQLPANYLRTPSTPHARKLSAGYTGHSSKLLLPINEQSGQHHSPSQQTLHRHNFHHPNDLLPTTPTHHRDSRLDVEHKKLARSATASFPLVSHAGTPPASPGFCFRQQQFFKESQGNLLSAQHNPIHIQIPVPNDGIIITPATPLPSPSPSSQQLKQQDQNHQQRIATTDDMPEFPLERTCSVYRNRKLEANEPTKINIVVDEEEQQQQQLQQQFYPGGMPNGNGGHHTRWADEFCEGENRALGVCTCDHIECAQGRAAWLERGRRCSVQDPNQASFNRRWVKRNRVQDSSIAGSSDDEDLLGVIRGPSTFANAFLYIGLGTISLGSIIFFVGTGEKGFKTQELRLIGPALAGIGVVFCILRIMFCVCPSHCISQRDRNKKDAKADADHRTSLLRDTKRVSIARGPYINSKIPMSSSQSSQFPPKSIVKNKSYEGVEALRQIASTSLFLDNEQKVNGQTIPTIKEPEEEPPIELKKIDTLKVDTLNVIDIMSMTDEETEREIRQIDINQEVVIPSIEPMSLFSDEDCDADIELDSEDNKNANKLHRQRKSLNQTKVKDSDFLLMETSLTIIDHEMSPPPFSPPPALPLSPNIVTTQFNREVGFLSLPLTSTTMEAAPTTTSDQRKHHHHKHRHHHHHKHRHSTAVGRTAPIDDRGHSHRSSHHQPPETEIVLSPSKLGQ